MNGRDNTSGPQDGNADNNGTLKGRVSKLEAITQETLERVVLVERDVAVIKSNYARREDVAVIAANYARRDDLAAIAANYATREDVKAMGMELLKAMNGQTWRLLTFMTSYFTVMLGAVYYIARNVH